MINEAGALDQLMALPGIRAGGDLAMAVALGDATAAIARLDQALTSRLLRQAFLYRARLDAVRRQAAVDGALIDPWHLVATLEGLRLRMDPYLRIKTSYTSAAVDVLAAAPVLLATTLASILGIAVKNAIRILEELPRMGTSARTSSTTRNDPIQEGLMLTVPGALTSGTVATPSRPSAL